MTPEQKRLLCPLTRQTPVQTACNLVSAMSLAWPFSIARAAVMGYCETFVAVLDPISLPAACGMADERRSTNGR